MRRSTSMRCSHEGFRQPARSLHSRLSGAQAGDGPTLSGQQGRLSRFDRYIATLDPPVQSVTREVVHGWLAAQPNLAPRTLCGKASILRQFCRYLARLDPCTYIPEAHLPASDAAPLPGLTSTRRKR